MISSHFQTGKMEGNWSHVLSGLLLLVACTCQVEAQFGEYTIHIQKKRSHKSTVGDPHTPKTAFLIQALKTKGFWTLWALRIAQQMLAFLKTTRLFHLSTALFTLLLACTQLAVFLLYFFFLLKSSQDCYHTHAEENPRLKQNCFENTVFSPKPLHMQTDPGV